MKYTHINTGRLLNRRSFLKKIAILSTTAGITACTDEVVAPPVLEIADADAGISFDGAVDGATTLDVTTNRKIAAVSSQPEWCTVTISEGEATRLSISVSANPDAADRTATVIVSATGTSLAPVEIKVTQSLTPQITVAAEDLSLKFTGDAAAGKNIRVQTTGDKPFTAISSQEWCNVSILKNYVTVALIATPGAPLRTAEITLSAEGMANLIITVEQAAFTEHIIIDAATQLAHHVKGETNTSTYITLITNFPGYEVASDQTWCTVSKFEAENRHQIKLAVVKNETGAARTANITIAGKQKSVVATLTQDAANHQTGYPRFAVLSDTHFDNTENGESATVKVSRALKNLVNKGGLDGIFVVGDITNDAELYQYDHLVETFSNTENVPANIPVHYVMGNHDNYNGGGSKVEYIFIQKTYQNMFQYLEIKGFPFILIGQTGVWESDYNHAAQRFLTESLADAAANYPGKPIFVFVHVPPINTCYGSTYGSPVFPPLLKPYPQVIVFSGHSHATIRNSSSFWQGEYTAVNEGSNYRVTEGVIVNLAENGASVVMERWDTWNNEEILPQWAVNVPYDGTN
jgi:predicted MPP superfamily phosphohydrolase